jgi:hypothetical protein
VRAAPENELCRCARGDEGWALRFSAKLERCDTEGDESLRGVCKGVVVVDETAVVDTAAGLCRGDIESPYDDVGREFWFDVAIGTSKGRYE